MPTKSRKPTVKKKPSTRTNVPRSQKTSLGSNLRLSRGQLLIVIAAVVAIGALIVWFVRAGSLVATEPESWPASGGNVKPVADGTASGGSYVEFLAPTTTIPGLPSGVTLTPPDGGQQYNGKFSNGFPNTKTFFPMSVYSPFGLNTPSYDGKTRAQAYAAAGVNTLMAPANSPCSETDFMDTAKANGLRTINWVEKSANCGIDSTVFKTKYVGTLAGWLYQDEAEGQPCSTIDPSWLTTQAGCTDSPSGKVSGTSFINMSNIVRSLDTTRPVVQGFTQGYALDWYLNGTQAQLAQSSDYLTYDIYSLTDLRCYPAYDGCGKPWGYYTHVNSARKGTGYKVPVWPDLETSAVFDTSVNPKQYQPTAADVKATVMQSIIGGARGIQWFKNCFCNVAATQDTFIDSRYAAVNTAIGQVSAQVQRLAYVINSDFANGYYTVSGNVNSMAKYDDRDGSFYIFAGAHQDASQTVTFSTKSAQSVQVVDENRTLAVSGNSFNDTFVNGTAYHIYKVTP